MTGGTPTVDVHAHAIVPATFGLVAGEPGLQKEREADLVNFGAETMKNQQAMLAEIWPILTVLVRWLEKMYL